jgi:hypothetical protein
MSPFGGQAYTGFHTENWDTSKTPWRVKLVTPALRTARLKASDSQEALQWCSPWGPLICCSTAATKPTASGKAADGHGASWTKAFGFADDYDEADGDKVLTLYAARDKAKELARGNEAAGDTAPVTVDGALDDYEADLRACAHLQMRNGHVRS